LAQCTQFKIKHEQQKAREATAAALREQQAQQLQQTQLPVDLLGVDYASAPYSVASPPPPPAVLSPVQEQASASNTTTADIAFMICKQFVGEHTTVIELKKQTAHFDFLPRVPLTKHIPLATNLDFSGLSPVERAVMLVNVSVNRRLVLTAGHAADNSVCCRAVDHGAGTVAAAADFIAHRAPVVCLSSDVIAGTQSVVVASADRHGQVLVWTLFQLTHAPTAVIGVGGPGGSSPNTPSGSNGGSNNSSNTSSSGVASSAGASSKIVHYGISRRPQRMFRATTCPSIGSRYSDISPCIDLSWNMGVVVHACLHTVSIFSIERDELVRHIDMRGIFAPRDCDKVEDSSSFARVVAKTDNSISVDQVAQGAGSNEEDDNSSVSDTCCTARMPRAFWDDMLAHFADQSDILETAKCTCSFAVQRVALSADGYIVLHITYKLQCNDLEGNSTRAPEERAQSLLVTMSLNGHVEGLFWPPRRNVAITFLSIPNRGPTAIIGMEDGTVNLLNASDLAVLKSWPITTAGKVLISPALNMATGSKSAASASPVVSNSAASASLLPSAIISVTVGPDPSTPAVIVATTVNGDICVQPLPDYISWERVRTPTALQQLVHGPMGQAVTRTIQQAQNIQAWTSEQAESIAQNARDMANDTLKKVCMCGSKRQTICLIYLVCRSSATPSSAG
jgi:hypothetical protein